MNKHPRSKQQVMHTVAAMHIICRITNLISVFQLTTFMSVLLFSFVVTKYHLIDHCQFHI